MSDLISSINRLLIILKSIKKYIFLCSLRWDCRSRKLSPMLGEQNDKHAMCCVATFDCNYLSQHILEWSILVHTNCVWIGQWASCCFVASLNWANTADNNTCLIAKPAAASLYHTAWTLVGCHLIIISHCGLKNEVDFFLRHSSPYFFRWKRY